MEGRVMMAPNGRSLVNHHDPGIYDTLCSPLGFCQANRRIENGISLMSDQIHENGLSETSSEVTLPKIHFAKWYDSKSDAISGGSGGSQRSLSLSPKSTQPAVKPAYRPPTPHSQTSTPTPTHRGILKGQRPHLDATAGRDFWDNVDFRNEVNSSCNSISSSNLAESLSRKTVRFADGKPTMSNRIAQAPCGSIRGSEVCNIGPITQGIYEWEAEGGSLIPTRVTGGLNRPPRPPILRPTQRNERRATTDCLVPSSGIRYLPGVYGVMGVEATPPVGLTSLPAPEGTVTKAGDDTYANYDSIYRNEGRLFPGSMNMEGTDSQRLHVFADSECPYLMSSSPPTPPSASSGGPLHRAEVTISDFPLTSTKSASLSPALASTASPPIHFFNTFKPLPIRRSDGGNIEKTIDFTQPTAIDEVTLKLHPFSTPNNSRQQVPAQTQQQKRYLQLRVDVSQPPTSNAPLFLNDNSSSPLQAPPFTDSPRRRAKGLVEPPQALGATESKAGSLDRDGVWRPIRLPCSPPVSHSFVYPLSSLLTDFMGDSLFPERQHFRYAPHLFTTSDHDLGTNCGGYEVPIFVMPPSTTSNPSAASTSVSAAFHRQALSPKRIGIQSVNVPIKRI